MKLLTTAQAAEILGFHRVSVAWSIRNGLLKATRYGRAYLIKPEDLREYALTHPRPSRLAHIDLTKWEGILADADAFKSERQKEARR
jgi:excisionase family DNA binding protein